MNKIPIIFFLIAIGLVLFVLCLSSYDSKEWEFFSGILALYTGSIILLHSIKYKKTSMHGLRFRGILAGLMGVIIGLILVIEYFK